MSTDDEHSAPLRDLLEHGGYGAHTTWSGRDALEEITARRFDALVVDDYLADLYVGEFIERVCRIPSHPCLIVVQGHHRRIDAHELGSSGTFCVVEKAQPEQMLKAVDDILQRCTGQKLGQRSTGDGHGP